MKVEVEYETYGQNTVIRREVITSQLEFEKFLDKLEEKHNKNFKVREVNILE